MLAERIGGGGQEDVQGTVSISSLDIWLKGSLFWTPFPMFADSHKPRGPPGASNTNGERVFSGLPSRVLLCAKAQLTYCA